MGNTVIYQMDFKEGLLSDCPLIQHFHMCSPCGEYIIEWNHSSEQVCVWFLEGEKYVSLKIQFRLSFSILSKVIFHKYFLQ